jgi:aerobic carbon-monoxide dehydrogenase large subunit
MVPFAPGESVPRSEDWRLLTGGGRFLDDCTAPDPIVAAFVRSPHAHAHIVSIKTAEILRIPGVLAVLTGADYRADGLGFLPCQDQCRRRDGSPMVAPLRPAVPEDRVRFVGEPVAMVIAETDAIARDAAERLVITYEPLPAVLGAGGSPPLHDSFADNEAFYKTAGDASETASVFSGARHIVEQTLHNHRVTANTMEPRGYLGEYDAASEHFTLRGGVHSPHTLRGQLARDVFHLPEDRFRVITGDVGGSFGMRGAIYPELALVLWAARRIGRPVKWVASRSEGLTGDDHGRDVSSHAALALDGDGNFLGLRVSITANMGAWLGIKGPRSPLNTLNLLSGLYHFPAKDISVAGIFTNTNPISPYRGAGGPEAGYILERLIDKAARETGFDRIELRRRNLIGEDAMPYDTGLGLVYDCGAFGVVMEKALVLADVAGFAGRRAASQARGRRRGLSICNAIEQTARPGLEGAAIEISEQGGAIVRVGTASQGQGHETIWKQLVCGRLGFAPDRVRVLDGDSEGVLVGGGTFNSRSAVSGGMAVTRAVEEIIERGREIASTLLEATIADIAFEDGCFTIVGTDRSVSLDEIAASVKGLTEEANYSADAPTFPNGTHICEVEIDGETGRVEIASYVAVDDVGVELNPMLLAGQIHGGVAQGIGQALMEAVIFESDSGQNLTGSFMDYAMPRADDLCFIETGSHSVPTALNPLGVKGAGEAGTVGALPATMCAICDALGTDDVPMPATPEVIWRVLTGAQRQEDEN